MKIKLFFFIILISLVGCGGGGSAINSISTPTPIVHSIIISNTTNPPAGLTDQMRAIGMYTDGTTRDITKMVSWISTDTNILTIDTNGLVTGIVTGSASITASYQSQPNITIQSNIFIETILDPTPLDLVISFVNSGITSLQINASTALQAIIEFSNKTFQSVSSKADWIINSINDRGKGFVSVNSFINNSILTGTSQGLISITANYLNLGSNKLNLSIYQTDVQQAQQFFSELKTDLIQFGYNSNSSDLTIKSIINKIQTDLKSRSLFLRSEIDTIVLIGKIIGFLDDLQTNGTSDPFGTSLPTATSFSLPYLFNERMISCSLYTNSTNWANGIRLSHSDITNNTQWEYIACRNPSQSNFYSVVDSSGNLSPNQRYYSGPIIVIQKPVNGTNIYNVSTQTKVSYETLQTKTNEAGLSFLSWIPFYQNNSFVLNITKPSILDQIINAGSNDSTYFNAMPKMIVKLTKQNSAISYYGNNLSKFEISGYMAPGYKVDGLPLPGTIQFDADKISINLTLDKKNTSSESGIDDSEELIISGKLGQIDINNSLSSNIEIRSPSFVKVTRNTRFSGYEGLNLSIGINTYTNGSLIPTSSISGALSFGDMKLKTINSINYYEPTTLIFDGSFSYSSIGKSDLKITFKDLGYMDYNPNIPSSEQNYKNQSIDLIGNLALLEKSPISISATLTSTGYKKNTLLINYNDQNSPTYWKILANIDNTVAPANEVLIWSASSNGLTFNLNKGDNKTNLLKNGSVIAIIDIGGKRISYYDGSFEQF